MPRFFTFLIAALSLFGCQKSAPVLIEELSDAASIQQLSAERAAMAEALELPPSPQKYNKPLLNYLTVLGLRPASVDDQKATIGRVLFYEKGLSADGKISCASCHRQSLAFSDNVAKSVGIFGRQTLRNSPPLANVARVSAHYASIDGQPSPHFFWDNRAATVAEQSAETMANELEMGFSAEKAVEFVGSQLYYGPIWRQAFGHFSPQKEEILECLEAFVGAIGSTGSRLDAGLEAVGGNLQVPATVVVSQYYGTSVTAQAPGISQLTLDENYGRALFVKHCTECHSPLRSVQKVFEACNGLDANYADNGLGERTKNASDMGVFKSPSLRNVALTGPYMHDGRFKTLSAVIDFYDSGIQPHPNLHELLKNPDGTPKKMNLSGTEKAQLLAFLKALTDPTLSSDKRFSNPFK